MLIIKEEVVEEEEMQDKSSNTISLQPPQALHIEEQVSVAFNIFLVCGYKFCKMTDLL